MRVKVTILTPLTSGFTLIEILLVIALILILGASTTPLLSQLVGRNQLSTHHQLLVAASRKAQAFAMDNRLNTSWGLCSVGNTIRLFAGSCGSPSYQENIVLPSWIVLSGLSTVTFNDRGEPSAATTISLTSPQGSATVSLLSSGAINW